VFRPIWPPLAQICGLGKQRGVSVPCKKLKSTDTLAHNAMLHICASEYHWGTLIEA